MSEVQPRRPAWKSDFLSTELEPLSFDVVKDVG